MNDSGGDDLQLTSIRKNPHITSPGDLLNCINEWSERTTPRRSGVILWLRDCSSWLLLSEEPMSKTSRCGWQRVKLCYPILRRLAVTTIEDRPVLHPPHGVAPYGTPASIIVTLIFVSAMFTVQFIESTCMRLGHGRWATDLAVNHLQMTKWALSLATCRVFCYSLNKMSENVSPTAYGHDEELVGASGHWPERQGDRSKIISIMNPDLNQHPYVNLLNILQHLMVWILLLSYIIVSYYQLSLLEPCSGQWPNIKNASFGCWSMWCAAVDDVVSCMFWLATFTCWTVRQFELVWIFTWIRKYTQFSGIWSNVGEIFKEDAGVQAFMISCQSRLWLCITRRNMSYLVKRCCIIGIWSMWGS